MKFTRFRERRFNERKHQLPPADRPIFPEPRPAATLLSRQHSTFAVKGRQPSRFLASPSYQPLLPQRRKLKVEGSRQTAL
jgi:hypothetical protein